MNALRIIVFTAGLLALAIAGGPSFGAARAVPVDGDPFAARLVKIDANWRITFRAGNGQRVLNAADLVHWGARPRAANRPQVLLADGSVIVVRRIEMSDDHLVVHTDLWGKPAGSDLWGQVRLPLERLRGVILHPPADLLQRDLLARRILSNSGQDDRLLLDNGDLLAGVLTSWNVQQMTLDTPGGAAAIPTEKIRAVLLNPALAAAPKPRGIHALLGFRNGTCLSVTKVQAVQQGVRLTLPGGFQLNSNPDISIWDEIVLLRPLGGRVTYLSDLEPISYRHVPFLNLAWPHYADKNVLGGRLRGGAGIYSKGLGMHSTSRLTYRLQRAYRRLEAELALDEWAGRRGSVTFRVFVDDGAGKLKQIYKSPIVRGGQQPVTMSLSIAGVRRISLVVDYADRGDERDYANWLNARLVE